MYARVETITPERAAELLKKNNENRKLSKFVVNRYATAMKAGDWEENGEPICISEDGTLKNGQHRLYAIIEANVSVNMLVVYDVKNNIHEYDRGQKRTMSHILEMNSYPASITDSVFVGAINFLCKKTTGKLQTDNETIRIIDNFGNICTSVMPLICVGARKPIARLSPCAAAVLVSLYYGVDEAILKKFFECVNSGFTDSRTQSSAIVLRNYMIQNRSYTAHEKVELYLATLSAIQDFKNGMPRKIKYYFKNPIPLDVAMTETLKEWLS